MIYAGIDYSTYAVDVVTINAHEDFLDNTTVWKDGEQVHGVTPVPTVKHHRVEFTGDNAWARAFDAADKLNVHPYNELFDFSSFTTAAYLPEDIDVIVIEEPAGSSRLVAQQLARVQGIILAHLPRIDGQVWGMVAPEWKKLVLGKGNASKADVQAWISRNWPLPWNAMSGELKRNQDAADAYCMALAGKKRSDGTKVQPHR